MKTTFSKHLAVLCIALAAFFVMPAIGRAQVSCGTNWTVNNNTGCTILINYFYICDGISCSTGNISVPVSSGSFVTIPACISGTGPCSVCDVLVRITKIATVPYSGPGVDRNSTSVSVNGTGTGCFTSTGNMTWNAATSVVNINP